MNFAHDAEHRNKMKQKSTNLVILIIVIDQSGKKVVLSNLPLIVVDIINDQWILSDFLCKVHYLSDNLNKTMSTMVLVILSFDRFLTICRPTTASSFKTTKVTLSILVAIFIFCSVLLSPLIFSTGLATVYLDLKTAIVKCSYLELNFHFERYFFYMLLMFGFCVPLLLILTFHGAILTKICGNKEQMRRPSWNRTNFVMRKIVLLVTFYFLCWAPYWLFNLYVHLTTGFETMNNENESHIAPQNWLPAIGLFFHIMVYANSALNPFIYGLLNYELRRQYNRALKKSSRLASAHLSLTALARSQQASGIELDSSASSLLGRFHSFNIERALFAGLQTESNFTHLRCSGPAFRKFVLLPWECG
uniref:G-protein coupled receptors family 1 profile domain-containing protein n=1 Tax=Romanomermis culicivorax TaxID=13658 RepID=A0A915IK17_ROMCU